MAKLTSPAPKQLPDGTVTFLFTDIEGSTRLWEQYPEVMQLALARHDHLLRETINFHDGLLVKSTGDGLQAVFVSPHDALQAALAAQQALVTEPWPESIGQLRVRMALHTATAELREGDYFGSSVNRAARLMDTGHGGQILLSLAVEELIRDDLPADVRLLDLGQHRLKDLSRPEHIFQLIGPDLPSDFPELKTAQARPSNLPTQPTLFIGRDQEMADLSALFSRDEVRLVTITGPGGIGKTRLSLRAATGLFQDGDGLFHGGAFFVDLVPVEDPTLIPATIAAILGVGESGDHSLVESLEEYLKTKSVLLVIDNMEHLLDGVELFSRLLLAAPGLKLLATSREALNLREEWLFPLEGLPYPKASTTADAGSFGAIQLFSAGAGRVRPDFSLVEEQEDVIRICRLVEGMPLAIELAAVWTKSLSCRAIADEIQRNVDFLETRLRNLPARHRSMRATFNYSWQHLAGGEKVVFSRLAVFRGGFSREAAGKIAGASVSLLTGLVDKSLLRWEPGSTRYQVHELLRQFAAEKLEEDAGARDKLFFAHSRYFADYGGRQATLSLEGRPHEALECLEIESENIYAAWLWAIAKGNTAEIIRAVPALVLMVTNKNQYNRGLDEFGKAVKLLRTVGPDPNNDLAVATTLVEMAWLQIRLGRLADAETSLLESQDIYHRLDVPPAMPGAGTDPALALGIIASIRGDYALVEQLGQNALRTSEQFDQRLNSEFAYYLLTRAAVALGQYDLAQERAMKMKKIIDETNDQWMLAYCLLELGNVSLGKGDMATARKFFQEAYTTREKFDDHEGMAVALNHLGKVLLHEEKYEDARQLFQRSFQIYEEIGDRGGLATTYNGLANSAVGEECYRTAQNLFSDALSVATDIQFAPLILAILTGIGQLLSKTGRGERGQNILLMVSRHPATEFETRQLARNIITHYRIDKLVEEVMADDSPEPASGLDQVTRTISAELRMLKFDDPPSTSPIPGRGGKKNMTLVEPLTDREMEILGHIAAGLTNKQIAELLIISAGTVKWYTSQIYGKLSVRNRTQAVTRARDMDLLP